MLRESDVPSDPRSIFIRNAILSFDPPEPVHSRFSLRSSRTQVKAPKKAICRTRNASMPAYATYSACAEFASKILEMESNTPEYMPADPRSDITVVPTTLKATSARMLKRILWSLN